MICLGFWVIIFLIKILTNVIKKYYEINYSNLNFKLRKKIFSPKLSINGKLSLPFLMYQSIFFINC
ncbi:hypothetical protein KU06062659_500007 [Flavobacterium psychrophilum]|nr:hypothetical protein FI146_570015 [Flavobacterium psychrophilum]SNB13352.1 hypothetical protein FPC831_880018 [Flavobacterium psychrophilum]SNB18681.1 hypothetical protein KU06062659_500007 [Flavobacterium psychrophilum]SNB18791.1 hypothetical protein KU05112810_80007 [Flavobacterium psychrophilum]SNB20114.1 hypothetical protein KU06112801_760007 [Flavobacterium psychrophilum]